ncbi:tRNA-specific 2-thiouridylase MnmA [hydrothermal vent metagenome]|uniref:tRNA-specific 2-thiouridylase MnmA n=1 Tax=hydrothermal vent metagenome TaxID=652676 RepID=A0A3B0YZU9_9ZZZZ
MNGDKVIVGLSGGVDSAVAALLLLQQGYDVEATFMKNWDEDDEASYCPAEQDLIDAQAVADQLGIKLRTISFSSEYWDRVFEYFLSEYKAGRTPNPDILCNQEIKFRAFLDYALGLGADWIATGHYAQVTGDKDSRQLLKGLDPDKDQSYFLYRLGQRALNHSLFPLGELHKPEVRAMAERESFANHAKKDSTGICFIGERKFKTFLERFIPAQPGEIVDTDGHHIGNHDGLMFHTIGQRQGLGIGGMQDSSGEPWYVCAKDIDTNRLIVAQGNNHPALFQPSLIANDMHWISGAPPEIPLHCQARIRYRQPDQACEICVLDGARSEVQFDAPQRAVAPGQAVVFYDGEVCLGGGTIQR